MASLEKGPVVWVLLAYCSAHSKTRPLAFILLHNSSLALVSAPQRHMVMLPGQCDYTWPRIMVIHMRITQRYAAQRRFRHVTRIRYVMRKIRRRACLRKCTVEMLGRVKCVSFVCPLQIFAGGGPSQESLYANEASVCQCIF